MAFSPRPLVIRCEDADLDAWKACALRDGMKVSAWARHHLRKVAEMSQAQVPVAGLGVGPIAERPPAPKKTSFGHKKKEEKPVAGMCVHRVPHTSFCAKC